MKPRTTRVAAAIALPLVLGLGACSGDNSSTSTGSSTSSAQGQSQQSSDPFTAAAGTQVDTNAFLQQTQEAQKKAKTFHIDMTMTAQGQSLKMTGDQDASDPNAPKAKIVMTAPSQQGQQAINLIMDGTNMYMQMPGQAGGKYVKVSMQQLAAQGGADFKKLMNPSESLKAQQQAIESITFKGEEDVSGQKLRRYSLLIDPVKAQKAAGATNVPTPTGTAAAKMPYDIWLDSNKLVQKMQLQQNGANIQMNLSKYGEPVNITVPPSSQVTTPPGMSGSGAAQGSTASPTAG